MTSGPSINVQKLQLMYRQVERLVMQLLDNVTNIFHKNGIRHFIKPSHDVLMRMITPYQLKVYVDFADVYCLFQNNRSIPNIEKNKEILKKDDIYKNLEDKEKIAYLKSNKAAQILYGMEGNIRFKRNKREKQKQIKKFNKNIIQEILKQQLCKWAKSQVMKGKSITRNNMKDMAFKIGAKYQTKFGQRWIKSFISQDFQLRNLLTHGNSSELRKKSNNSKNQQNKNKNIQWINQTQQQEDSSSDYGIYDQDHRYAYQSSKHQQGDQRYNDQIRNEKNQ